MAFWYDDSSANPDSEILNALRPAMATVPGALLLCISSPYARRGVLWEAYHQHFAKDGDPVLVWQADTRTMNPTVDEGVVAAAYEADEVAASAEYGALFRKDVESYVSHEAIEAVTIPDRLELPPVTGVSYVGFCDPAGGTGQDSMTLAIAHVEERDGRTLAILDAVREVKPPFSPEQTVTDFAQALRPYRITKIIGDRYAGDWPAEAFRKHGIEYEPAAKPKSDLYREALPLFTSKTAELLAVRRLLAQLAGLERRTARGGRDTIDHGPNGHDDVINAACGALLLASAPHEPPIQLWGGGSDPAPVAPETPEQVAAREAAAAQRERERREQSARAVADSVRRSGFYWPGG